MRLNDVFSDKSDFIAGTGVDLETINKAESELGLEFALDYKEYLTLYGLAGYEGHELTGLGLMPRLDVVRVTKHYRSILKNIPYNMYLVEDLNIDGITIWQDAQGTIFQVMLDGSFTKIYDNLVQYIENE